MAASKGQHNGRYTCNNPYSMRPEEEFHLYCFTAMDAEMFRNTLLGLGFPGGKR